MRRFLATTCLAAMIAATTATAHATQFVDLAGPATGFLAVNNLKNSTTQNGIEGKNSDGTFNPGHNGLPQYPNFQIPAGFTNGGVYSAVIASPQSTASDYSVFSDEFYGGAPLTVNNQTITEPSFSTLSAGRIDYDNDLVTGVGTETVGVGDLTFNFNTFLWDGNVTPAQTGDSRSNFDASFASPENPIAISPFSPVITAFNDGGGAGNAQLYYEISIDNVTGSGLTFVNGELTDMDFTGDVTINGFVAPFPTFGSLDYTGTLTAAGLDYTFDVTGTASASFFSGINLVMNRAGTASVVPEPASVALLAGGAMVALARRRRNPAH